MNNIEIKKIDKDLILIFGKRFRLMTEHGYWYPTQTLYCFVKCLRCKSINIKNCKKFEFPDKLYFGWKALKDCNCPLFSFEEIFIAPVNENKPIKNQIEMVEIFA